MSLARRSKLLLRLSLFFEEIEYMFKVFTTSKSLLALGTLGALARIREWIHLLQLLAPFTHSLSFNHF